MANARRRKVEGRVDDAVARLYRAIEALAQVRLADGHQISDTKHVPIERVPEPLRGQWTSRANEGVVFLGLQDAYALLDSMGDELGAKFKQLQLHDPQRSPLTSRNQSVLAHGFERVSENVFEKLWEAAIELASIQESAILSFPRIGG